MIDDDLYTRAYDYVYLEPQKNTPRKDILEEAIRLTTQDRDKDYGDPVETHRQIGVGWTEILGTAYEITPQQVALCMAWLKIVRAANHPEKMDHYSDGAGYFGIAGEAAERNLK